jgi:hypothetical protein
LQVAREAGLDGVGRSVGQQHQADTCRVQWQAAADPRVESGSPARSAIALNVRDAAFVGVVNASRMANGRACWRVTGGIGGDNREVTDTMLSLFDLDEHPPHDVTPPAPRVAPHTLRIVADSTDRVGWLRARSRGITATDVAKLATAKSVQNAAYDKIHGTGFSGNPFTDHGRAREPEIAAWVLANYGIEPSTNLYHAHDQRRHLATPDGVAVSVTGELELAEIKTTSKPWRSIPRSYLRQVWWQQYVLGAERTLVVWEQHQDFVPLHAEPECRWVDRDEDQIAILVGFANQLLEILGRQRQHEAQYPTGNIYVPAYRG